MRDAGDATELAEAERLLRSLRSEVALHGLAPSPFVTLSYAQALDGSMAGPKGAEGPRLMLSGDASMSLTHGLRAAHDAILVGVGTVEADDPQLTVRLVAGANPVRVVLDSQLRIPIASRALSVSPTSSDATPSVPTRTWPHAIVVTLTRTLGNPACAEKLRALRQRGVHVIGVRSDADGHVCLRAALDMLRERFGIASVMIEGGAAIVGSCARENLADRVIVTVAPKLGIQGLRPVALSSSRSMQAVADGDAYHLRELQAFCLGGDIIVSGKPPAIQPPPRSRL